MNGKNSVQIRTLNGVQLFDNQRYISKDKKDGFSFLSEYSINEVSERGYQSEGLMKFISYYSCKMSYQDVSELVENKVSERVYSSCHIQHKIIALQKRVDLSIKKEYEGLQLSFNFVDSQVDIYSPGSEEVLYFDDAIGVTKQKLKREDKMYVKDCKYVQTDNILLQNADKSYHYISFNKKEQVAEYIETQIKQRLTLEYGTTMIPLVAITDGASVIRERLHRMFGQSVKIILDWYHLEKKIWNYFTRFGFSKIDKERHVEIVLKNLWHGCVIDALIYTEQGMSVSNTKQYILEELQNYILKRQEEIIDYDTRYRIAKKTIGSGRGEKANDQTVADRQKHNGCSWSEKGSLALASIKVIQLNKQWETFWKAA